MPAVLERAHCPVTGVAGHPVGTSTVKALLRPHALATIDPHAQHYFCADPSCDTVYFAGERTFGRADLKVPVLAKDAGEDVPVCYCFGWTRGRLRADAARERIAPGEIAAHVQAERCACDVNNPRGVCCLGDVRAFVRRAAEPGA